MTIMKQKEIFCEEDFEKEPSRKQSSIWRKSWLWLSLFLIILICIYCIINCNNDKKTLPTLNIDTLSIENGRINKPIIVPNDTLTKIESLTVPKESINIDPVKNITKKTTEQALFLMAKRVIRGDYGNGIQRQKALGEDYEIIQEQVNRNYQNGDLYW